MDWEIEVLYCHIDEYVISTVKFWSQYVFSTVSRKAFVL